MTEHEKLRLVASTVEAGDDEVLLKHVEAALAEGVHTAAVLDDGLVRGMGSLGELFGAGEVFLPEVLAAATCCIPRTRSTTTFGPRTTSPW